MKRQFGPTQWLFPMPCAIVVGGTPERADGLAAAWINMVSSTPATVVVGLRDSRTTLAMIRESDTFTVNTPSASLAVQFDYFGTTCGADCDKFADTGLSLEPSRVVAAPIIAQCPFNLECRVTGEVEVGSYRVLLGEVVETHADESVLTADGKNIDMAALDPLAYIPGVREYHRLGGKVADAYTLGATLKKQS